MKRLVMMGAFFLTGCSTMDSHFSCNVTAGDSCLTIEQVDAMTRFADDVRPRGHALMKVEKSSQKQPGHWVKGSTGQLWLADKRKG